MSIEIGPANLRTDPSAALVALTYELLDAHDDTARLVDEAGTDERWAVHMEYLRRLQRLGREIIARETGLTGR